MQDFIEIATSIPTVVFSVLLTISLGFWIVMSIFGVGADALGDFDVDLDVDVDVDLDVGGGDSLDVDSGDIGASGDAGGALGSVLNFLGITSMPLLIGLNLFLLFAWMASMIAMTVLNGLGDTGRLIAALPVFVAAVFVGSSITRSIGRRFQHIFRPTQALRHSHLVGSICTITTQRVSSDFGQAEVRDEEGGSLIIQVRCGRSNDLVAGTRALIIDLDRERGTFELSPDPGLVP